MEKGYWEHEGKFEGVIPNLKRRYYETKSEHIRFYLNRFMSAIPCPDCHGERLKKESLAVTINSKSIATASAMSVKNLDEFITNLKLSEREEYISRQILKEISGRLGFLKSVGLDYIAINRESSTLSGGE